MLVAEGAVDIAGEFDLKPWDIAALVPVIREAGGRVTTVDGGDPLDDDSILVSNGVLHDRVLAVLREN
jgi:histidinol-phosphatase